MTQHTVNIGDAFVIDMDDRPLAEPCDEAWYILIATPQKDKALCAYLTRIGAVEAWRPTVTRWKAQRGPRKRVQYEASVAPGYVFALFDRRVRWHVLKDYAAGRMRHVVGGEAPTPIPVSVISAMQLVPGRIETIRKLRDVEERKRLLELIPQPGDTQARVRIGSENLIVPIESIDKGILHFVLNGIRGKVPQQEAERVKKP